MIKYKGSPNTIWGLLTALLILGALTLTLWGNSNNLNPRYLFIDEQITFYPIIKILNPSGLDEWLWLVSDGNDYRYGRILWNALALFAALPAKAFGVSGQIIASRELGAFLLLSSYCLLTFAYIKTPSIRFLALLTLVLLPYNSYYMSMPKPEPLAIFAISLFLFLNTKNFLAPGKASWMLVGLAFGAKISFLIPAAILILMSILNEIYQKRISINAHLLSCIYILAGFLIANPYFLQPVFYFSYPILIIYFIFRLFKPARALALLIIISFLCLAFIPQDNFHAFLFEKIPKLTGLNHAFGEWIRATFLKVNDGEMTANQNFYTWFVYLCKTLYPPFNFIGLAFIGLIVVFFTALLKNLSKQCKIDRQTSFNLFLLALLGLTLLCIPMISIKNRLWGMYLFPGLIFTCLALFAILDRYAESRRAGSFIRSNFHISTQIPLAIIYLFLLLTYWGPAFINSFIFLGARDPSDPKILLPPWLTGV